MKYRPLNQTDHTNSTIHQTLVQLQRTLDERKGQAPEQSYVASLHAQGLNKILEKIGEEATEVILAAKDAQHQNEHPDNKEHVTNEAADLFFHTFVAFSHLNIPIVDIFNTLENRLGTSGHTEKKARQT